MENINFIKGAYSIEIIEKSAVISTEYGKIAVIDKEKERNLMVMVNEWLKMYDPNRESSDSCIKRVGKTNDLGYVQLMGVLDNGKYMIACYDNRKVCVRIIDTHATTRTEVLEYMRSNMNIQKGLNAYVLRDSLGDCTNNGISKERNVLTILGDETFGFCEPEELDDCVTIPGRGEYVFAMPISYVKKWYMAGGNFLYTSDSTFQELTGVKYPVAIHDRCEN